MQTESSDFLAGFPLNTHQERCRRRDMPKNQSIPFTSVHEKDKDVLSNLASVHLFDHELACLKLDLLKENFEYRQFYWHFRENPHLFLSLSPIPAGDYPREPGTQVASKFDQHRDYIVKALEMKVPVSVICRELKASRVGINYYINSRNPKQSDLRSSFTRSKEPL